MKRKTEGHVKLSGGSAGTPHHAMERINIARQDVAARNRDEEKRVAKRREMGYA